MSNEITAPKRKGGSVARLTENDEKVIAVMLPRTGSEIAKAAGIPERTAYAIMDKPLVHAEIQRRLSHRVKTAIAIKAVDVYAGLLENAESEHVRADLAKDAMAQTGVRRTIDRADIRPANVSVQLNINLGPVNTTAGDVIEHIDNTTISSD